MLVAAHYLIAGLNCQQAHTTQQQHRQTPTICNFMRLLHNPAADQTPSICKALRCVCAVTVSFSNRLSDRCPCLPLLPALLPCLNANDSHLQQPFTLPLSALHLFGWGLVRGVALELGQKGGAHSPIPEISLKLFLLYTNNTAHM